MERRDIRPHLLIVDCLDEVLGHEFFGEGLVFQRNPICDDKPYDKHQKCRGDEAQVAAEQRWEPDEKEMANCVPLKRGGLVDTGMGARGEGVEIRDAAVVWKIAPGNRQIRSDAAVQIAQPIKLRRRHLICAVAPGTL